MSDPAQYPERPPFFAHRFCRLLTRAAVAQQIGPEACWLLTIVAHQEDTIHYRRAVTYYNEQLQPLCGFGSKRRLVEARRKAVEAGWLHYSQGAKGKPGIYWVMIPDGYQDIPDGPCDAGSDPLCRSETKRKADGTQTIPLQNETESGRKADGKRTESGPLPVLDPSPSPGPKRKRARKPATAFVKPTLEEVTEYCRERKNAIDPERFIDHYEANGWRVGGKSPMKDWQAAVRNWEKNGYEKGNCNGCGTNRRRADGDAGPEPGRIRERDWSNIPIISSDDDPLDESADRPVEP